MTNRESSRNLDQAEQRQPHDELVQNALALSAHGFETRLYRDHVVSDTPRGPRTYDRRYVVVAPHDHTAPESEDSGITFNVAYGMMYGEGEDRTAQVAFKTAEMQKTDGGVVHQVGVVRMNTMEDFGALVGLLGIPPHERNMNDDRVREYKDLSPAAYLVARYMQFIH